MWTKSKLLRTRWWGRLRGYKAFRVLSQTAGRILLHRPRHAINAHHPINHVLLFDFHTSPAIGCFLASLVREETVSRVYVAIKTQATGDGVYSHRRNKAFPTLS